MIVFGLLLFFGSPLLYASEKPSPHLNYEVVDILTDRRIYITGELIRFAVYIQNRHTGSFPNLSKVCYIQLINRNHNPVAKQAVEVIDGYGYGYIQLPDDLENDHYVLVAYTRWMINFQEAYAGKSLVTVINPNKPVFLKNDSFEPDFMPDEGKKMNETFNYHGVEISFNKEVYTCRDSVELEIGIASAETCKIFISVVKAGAEPRFSDQGTYPSPFTGKGSHPESPPFFQPESKGYMITGKILQTGVKSEIELYTLSNEERTNFNRTITRDGNFIFLPHGIRNAHPMIFFSPGLKQGVVLLDQPFDYFPSIAELMYPDAGIFQSPVIDELLMASRVTNAFRYLSEVKMHADDCRNFYGVPDQQVKMDEYIKLPVMEEVFREIVRGVLVFGRDHEMNVEVIGKYTNRSLGKEPCILVNGLPLTDPVLLSELNPRDVDRISLVQSKYLYQGKIWDGIIDIVLKDRGIPGEFLPDYFHQELIIFPLQKTGEEYRCEIRDKRIPEYRNVLYFNGNVRPDTHGWANVSFTTGDEKGEYMITVVVKGTSMEKTILRKSLQIN